MLPNPLPDKLDDVKLSIEERSSKIASITLEIKSKQQEKIAVLKEIKVLQKHGKRLLGIVPAVKRNPE